MSLRGGGGVEVEQELTVERFMGEEGSCESRAGAGITSRRVGCQYCGRMVSIRNIARHHC